MVKQTTLEAKISLIKEHLDIESKEWVYDGIDDLVSQLKKQQTIVCIQDTAEYSKWYDLGKTLQLTKGQYNDLLNKADNQHSKAIEKIRDLYGKEIPIIEDGKTVYEQKPICGGHHDVGNFEEDICEGCQVAKRVLDDVLTTLEEEK